MSQLPDTGDHALALRRLAIRRYARSAFRYCRNYQLANRLDGKSRISTEMSAWRQETGVGRYPPLNMPYGRLPDRTRKCLLPYNRRVGDDPLMTKEEGSVQLARP